MVILENLEPPLWITHLTDVTLRSHCVQVPARNYGKNPVPALEEPKDSESSVYRGAFGERGWPLGSRWEVPFLYFSREHWKS